MSGLDLRIDRLRGLFAFFVALGHTYDVSLGYIAKRMDLNDKAEFILGAARGFLGFIWVIGFVVLSGYCIARACERRGAAFSVSGYVLLRVTRIYPLLIVATCVAFVFETAMQGSEFRPALWTAGITTENFLLTLSGVGAAFQYGSMAPAYTISFELFYYAFWGVIWFAFARSPRVLCLSLCFSSSRCRI